MLILNLEGGMGEPLFYFSMLFNSQLLVKREVNVTIRELVKNIVFPISIVSCF